MNRRAFLSTLAAVAAAPVALLVGRPAVDWGAAPARALWLHAGRRGGKTFAAVAAIPKRELYGRIRISGPVLEATRHQRGAFAEACAAEYRALARAAQAQFERDLLR